jgi:putative FmdB family regulatory protein
MPIYAYKCADCGHEKEVLQKITDAPLTDCPDCGHPSLAKQVTAAGFQLKGSGWYATDFRNKDSGGKAAKPDGKAESANDSKADSGSSSSTSTAAGSHACGSGGCASCS